MGVGRLGNFIDGQIVGAVTDVPWAVKCRTRKDSAIRSFSTTASRICSSAEQSTRPSTLG